MVDFYNFTNGTTADADEVNTSFQGDLNFSTSLGFYSNKYNTVADVDGDSTTWQPIYFKTLSNFASGGSAFITCGMGSMFSGTTQNMVYPFNFEKCFFKADGAVRNLLKNVFSYAGNNDNSDVVATDLKGENIVVWGFNYRYVGDGGDEASVRLIDGSSNSVELFAAAGDTTQHYEVQVFTDWGNDEGLVVIRGFWRNDSTGVSFPYNQTYFLDLSGLDADGVQLNVDNTQNPLSVFMNVYQMSSSITGNHTYALSNDGGDNWVDAGGSAEVVEFASAGSRLQFRVTGSMTGSEFFSMSSVKLWPIR